MMKWILIFVSLFCAVCLRNDAEDLAKSRRIYQELVQKTQASKHFTHAKKNTVTTNMNLIMQGLYNAALISDLLVQQIKLQTVEKNNCNLIIKLIGNHEQLVQFFQRINRESFLYQVKQISMVRDQQDFFNAVILLQVDGYLFPPVKKVKKIEPGIESPVFSHPISQLMLKGYFEYQQKHYAIIGLASGDAFLVQSNQLVGREKAKVLSFNQHEIWLLQGKKFFHLLNGDKKK